MSAPHRVAFLLPHLRPGGAERAVLNWLGALDRARFAPMLMLGRIDGDFLDALPADVTPVAIGAARALRAPRAIARRLADHGVAVAYSATNAMNLALLAAPGRGVARIVSEHTQPAAYLAEARAPRLRRLAMRHLYPRAAAVAVPTDAIAAELATVLGRALPTATIPNPVVAALPPLPPPARGDPPRLVAAGRLVPAKGMDLLIDAAARLAAAGTAFRLDIFGDGPLRAALAARIAAAGLGDRVALRGHAADLDAELRRADLFVLASRREGFGNVVVEAMAAGAPVLATRGGGPEAIVRDGRDGFLVAPDDADALAAAIAGLLAAPDRRRAVRAAARETAGRYGIAASVRRLEAMFAGALKTKSTPPCDQDANVLEPA